MSIKTKIAKGIADLVEEAAMGLAARTEAKPAAKAVRKAVFNPPKIEPVVTQAGRRGLPVRGIEQLNAQHPNRFGAYATVRPRRPAHEVEIVRGGGTDTPDLPVFSPERLQGADVVTLLGDKSIAGPRVRQVNDIPVDVETQGGPRFGALHAALKSPAAWASMLPQISVLRNKIRTGLEAGRDVYGLTTTMSPQSLDQTTMMSDLLHQMAVRSPIRKKDLRAFDKEAAQIIPGFAGLTHPEVMEQLAGVTQGKRKALVGRIDTAPRLAAGFPDVMSARLALTEDALRDTPAGASGFSVIKFGPDSLEHMDPLIEHPSYGAQIAGDVVGQLEQQVPFDLVYPDFIRRRREAGLSPGDDLRALELSKPTQTVDQEMLDRHMEYLAVVRERQ